MKKKIKLFIILTGNTFDSVEHLGPCYIKSYLEDKGINVDIEVIYEKELNRIYDILKEVVVKMVAFTMFAGNAKYVVDAATKVKALYPNVHITVGGPTTLNQAPIIMEKCSAIDSVSIGESEITIYELAELVFEHKSLSSCAGIYYRSEDGEITQTEPRKQIENLDELPFPSRCIFEKHPSTFFRLAGARGCLGHCTFCDGASLKYRGKERVRVRSAKNIVDEMEYLINKYNVNTFQFIDPTFEDPYEKGNEKAWGVIHEIERRNLNVNFNVCSRAELITEDHREFLRALRNNGLDFMYLGIEAGNASDLKLYGKIASVEDNERAIRILREEKINFWYGFINFNPYSTYETLLQNCEFLHNNEMADFFWPFQTRLEMYPAASLCKKLFRDGLVDKEVDFLTDIHSYKFADERIGELCECITGINTTLAQGLFNEKINMLEKKVRIAGEDKYLTAFQDIMDKRKTANEYNYMFFKKLIQMSQSGASKECLKKECDKFSEYCEKFYEDLYNKYWSVVLKFGKKHAL